jgi:hypothetical protein
MVLGEAHYWLKLLLPGHAHAHNGLVSSFFQSHFVRLQSCSFPYYQQFLACNFFHLGLIEDGTKIQQKGN